MVANLAFGLTMVLAIGVGGRLVRAGSRTRQLPELVFGGAILSQALSGVGMNVAPALLPADSIWLGATASLVLEAAGSVAVGMGCWLIFRRGERWALGLALALGAGALALTAARLLLADPARATAASPLGDAEPLVLAQGLTNLGVVAVYGWMAAEAIRYGLLMRRRLRLGLDRPIVVHQFVLWGLACAVVVAINVWVVAVLFLTGVPSDKLAWSHASVAGIGLVGIVALWCSFFPPRFYRAWAERGSEATA